MKLIEKIREVISKVGRSESLIMEALQISLTELYDMQQVELSSQQVKDIDAAVDATLKRIPLARIFHRKFFWKNTFHVSPYTLDPRPETEMLVEYATRNYRPAKLLDIGSGTGCILLSLLQEFANCYGVGTDISEYALETAKYNANILNIKADFFLEPPQNEKFDLIISNPPYIRGDCEYEALFDPPLSLWDNGCYQQIIDDTYLTPNGAILVEAPRYALQDLEDMANRKCMKFKYHSISEAIIIFEARIPS